MRVITKRYDPRDIEHMDRQYYRYYYDNQGNYCKQIYKVSHIVTVVNGYIFYNEIGENIISSEIITYNQSKPEPKYKFPKLTHSSSFWDLRANT